MDPKKLVSQKEAAERLNLTTRQVRNLADLGMPTRSDQGKVLYPFPDCFEWYLAYKVQKAVAAVEPEDSEEAKRRLTTAQARKAEIEVAELENRKVDVADAVREVGAMLDGLRSNLLAFTSKHSHELVGCKTIPEVTAKLEPAIHQLMSVLSGEEAA